MLVLIFMFKLVLTLSGLVILETRLIAPLCFERCYRKSFILGDVVTRELQTHSIWTKKGRISVGIGSFTPTLSVYSSGFRWLDSCERGQRHMEAVLKEVARTVEMLAVCESRGVVAQWDERTVSRACDAALYCEKLFTKFHDNPAVRTLMEKQLQITNQSLRAAFPDHTDISFQDLSRCQHLLLGRLLSNPALPLPIIQILFSTSSPLCAEDTQGVTGLCSQLIQCKSACKILSPVTDSHRISAVGADAEVQGEMLMERLDTLLNPGSGSSRAEHFLDSVPQGCPGAVEHFCLVIAAALLTRTESQTASEDILLSWLQQRHNLLQHLCSAQPTALLTDLAKKHVKFRVAYCDTLKRWASDMEYDVDEGEWVRASSSSTVSFQKLTEHFVALLEACPSLREDVETELKALKMNDGDFDVRGLSVWGDLLSEIHR